MSLGKFQFQIVPSLTNIMQTCKDCWEDYNEFTSGTPASEHRCDDCAKVRKNKKEEQSDSRWFGLANRQERDYKKKSIHDPGAHR